MEELDRLEEEFNKIAGHLISMHEDRRDDKRDPELTLEANDTSLLKATDTGETQKLIELSSHLLDKCKKLTEEKEDDLDEDSGLKIDLENQNELLKQKLETVEGILARREEQIEHISQENYNLESMNRSNERRMQKIKNEYKVKEELGDERSADFGNDLEDSNLSHSFNLIKTTETKRPRRNNNFNTFNAKTDDYSVEAIRLTKVVKSLVDVTNQILNQFKSNKEQFQGQERVLTRIDNEVEKIMRKQQELITEHINLNSGVDDISLELEEHWKLIEQITTENKVLNEKVYRIGKTDLPALKTFLLGKSNMMMNTLMQSTNMMNATNNMKSSNVLSNQLKGTNAGNIQPTGNAVYNNEIRGSMSSLVSMEEVQEEYVKQDSLNMRVDGSLESTEFLGARDGEDDDVHEMQKSSITEDEEITSKSSFRSDIVSNSRGSFDTKEDPNEKDDDKEEEGDKNVTDSMASEKYRGMSVGNPLEAHKTFTKDAPEIMVKQSTFKKRVSKGETPVQQIPLQVILERSKAANNRMTKSSLMIDDIGHNRSVRASMVHHRRRNSAMPKEDFRSTEYEKEPLPANAHNWKINGEQMYMHMVNSYNHQLRQKYICDLAAVQVLSERKLPGFDINMFKNMQKLLSNQSLGDIHYEESKAEYSSSRHLPNHIQTNSYEETSRKESSMLQSFKERGEKLAKDHDESQTIETSFHKDSKKDDRNTKMSTSRPKDSQKTMQEPNSSQKCCTIF